MEHGIFNVEILKSADQYYFFISKFNIPSWLFSFFNWELEMLKYDIIYTFPKVYNCSIVGLKLPPAGSKVIPKASASFALSTANIF